MKNIAFSFLLIFVICSCASLGQQSYSEHKVKEGETISAIADRYNVTVYELYRLNPDARQGLAEGQVLVLPGNKSGRVEPHIKSKRNADFKLHKVAKGETLYSLAKEYGVTEEAIKENNTQLYNAELRTGDDLRIPLNGQNKNSTASTQKATETNRKHVVQPKETVYGLASMYGITIAELLELNPDVPENLPIGTILNVPDKNYTDDAKLDDEKFGYYEVKQGETFFSLTRRWDMSEEDLIELNPSLEDGLQNGMVLKLPKEIIPEGEDLVSDGTQDLSKAITNRETKNVAVLLPFGTNNPTDSLKGMLQRNGVSRIALDFYSGAVMAVDSAKRLGVSTNLHVFDTQYERGNDNANSQALDQILNSDTFDDMNVVIGPLLGQNVKEVSDRLRRKNIPVVSPLTPKIEMASNLFQSRPNDNILREYMLDYIEVGGTGKNIIVIADEKNSDTQDKILKLHPEAKVLAPQKGDSGYFLNQEDISEMLEEEMPNWIILETNDIPLISNTITNANTFVDDFDVSLMTTLKGDAYDNDDIGNMTLMRLGFQFPSIDKQGNVEESQSNFAEQYREKFGVNPNNYAIRGFDLTLDTLLRLASADDLYASAKSGVETRYLENKFNYVKADREGYSNTAVYILRYGPGLILEEIKIPTQVIEKDQDFKD